MLIHALSKYVVVIVIINKVHNAVICIKKEN